MRFPGIPHVEAVEREIPRALHLIENIIEAGTVGTIAALPEHWKSWLAQEIAFKVAGGGTVLGAKVVTTGPVGYWWQDDSEENELARLQAYANRHDLRGALPITWHLNEDLDVRKDLDDLRLDVEAQEQKLVVLDSFYNFTGGLVLKDEPAAEVFKQLKGRVCDPTGCGVLVVDHAPWPTEGNRGQRRGYGSVFKAAAIRWGIYLEREGGTMYVEARGNNVAGLKRTPVVFNEDTLELELVSVSEIGKRDLAEEIAAYLEQHHGAGTEDVITGVGARREDVRQLLNEDRRFVRVPPPAGAHPNSKCWAVQEIPAPLPGTVWDGTRAAMSETVPSDDSSVPRRGTESRDGTGDEPVPTDRTELGDEGFPELVLAPALADGHITEREADERLRLHQLVERARASA